MFDPSHIFEAFAMFFSMIIRSLFGMYDDDDDDDEYEYEYEYEYE